MSFITLLNLLPGNSASTIVRHLLAASIFLCLPSFAWAACELSGPIHDVTGNDNTENDWSSDGFYDAVGEVWHFNSEIVQYPLDLRSGIWCWRGGTVIRTDPLNETWSDAKHPNNSAFNAWSDNMVWDSVRIHNAHDAFRPDRRMNAWWEIRGSWVSYTRDDCIENDYFASGLVDDSLFDGCYVFISSRNGITPPDPPNTVTVQNSLIRLQKMPGPYGHPDPSVMGHGELFKYQADSPELVLKNNIFLIEGCAATKYRAENCEKPDMIGFKKLRECSNNIIVWVGEGNFPGTIPDDPSCVTVTTDVGVWEEARTAWLADHPEVARIEGLDPPPQETEPAPGDTVEPDPVVDEEPIPDETIEPEPISDTEPAPEEPTEPDPVVDTQPEPDSGGDTIVTDDRAPYVRIVSPIKGTKIFRGTSMWVEVDVSDNVGVSRLEVYVDNALFVFEGAGTHGFNVVVDASQGRSRVTAQAYDVSGNHSADESSFIAVR